jgi:hypothetical protein
MTTLTVEPQATHAETSTKTPEQIQQEAEQSGQLRLVGMAILGLKPQRWV